MRACQRCGDDLPLENRRGPRRKFCSTCRPPRLKSAPAAERSAPTLAPIGGCLDAARAELSAADALHTTSGQAALALAARIDSGDETGSALASLTKQLDEIMRRLARATVEVDDPLQALLKRDDLAVRRERRSG